MVKDFQPDPLCEPLSTDEQKDLEEVPIIVGHTGPRVHVKSPKLSGTQPREVLNLASFNFTGMANAPEITNQARSILREYGVGSCSPPGFYGTSDMHMKLEKTVAEFVRKEDSVVYSQGFSTISGAIPAFCKRGDIIVVDSGVNFAIQSGLQLSRSTLHWYEHNNTASLEAVLQRVENQMKGKKPLRRQFIVTEGLFESDGAISDLPKIVELAKRFKFRIILDESFSIGSLGRTGRGLTEHQNVNPDDIDFIVGNMAVAFGAGGGFCASSAFAVRHQRITGLSFVFSAAMPVMVANGATTAMHLLMTQPQRLINLEKNVREMRRVLDCIESVEIPSAPNSALIHIQIRSKYARATQGNMLHVAQKGGVEHDLSHREQECLLQEIIDRALNQGVLLVRSRRLRSIRPDIVPAGTLDPPSIQLAVSAEHQADEVARAADVVRASIVSVLGDARR